MWRLFLTRDHRNIRPGTKMRGLVSLLWGSQVGKKELYLLCTTIDTWSRARAWGILWDLLDLDRHWNGYESTSGSGTSRRKLGTYRMNVGNEWTGYPIPHLGRKTRSNIFVYFFIIQHIPTVNDTFNQRRCTTHITSDTT